MSALSKIRRYGFQVSQFGENQIVVSPSENLTDNQRDFLRQHKAEIICELKAEQLATAAKINLSPEHRKLLTDYLTTIGEIDSEVIHDFLSECSCSAEKLHWALDWARSLVKTKRDPEKLVTCGNCSYWRPIHQHGKGAGHCAYGVRPMGLAHWFDTLKQCQHYQPEKTSNRN